MSLNLTEEEKQFLTQSCSSIIDELQEINNRSSKLRKSKEQRINGNDPYCGDCECSPPPVLAKPPAKAKKSLLRKIFDGSRRR